MSSREYSEDALVEQATEDVLAELGWQVKTAWHNETFGPNGLLGRENKGEVILKRHLLAALQQFNPNLPDAAYTQAVNIIAEKAADKTLAQLNKEKHELLTKGVLVSYRNAKGHVESKTLRIFDFNTPLNNEFLAVRQLEVSGQLYNCRPDVVGFVNGIPLVFFELKAHHTGLIAAYNDNLTHYKDAIPEILHTNAFVILSNGTDSRVGTITSPYKYFLEWKRIEEDDEGIVSLDTMLRGTCEPHRLIDLFENFLLFDGDGADITKIMAKNHQYIGVNKVLKKANHIDDLKGKLGVFWHTQGSGKSYSMVFLCQKIHRKLGGSYTFLIVVDRTELENQLYETFTGCGAVTEKNIRATSRDDLRKLLSENHRYVFTLIHKFSINPKLESEYPLITDRNNIIVISDEAHRTQGGKFAQNMRFNAIPNASYLGFTGTPIIKDELELTKNIFGEYVSVYDFNRAIDDGATLPLRYKNRGEKLNIENPDLDERMAEIIETEDLDDDQRAKLQREFSRDYPILTSDVRLDAIAKDLVWHFNERGYQGKGMYVALDKPTAVRMYDLAVNKYWPMYVDDLKQRIEDCDDQQQEVKLRHHLIRVEETEVCVVVSAEQNEISKFKKLDLDIEPHRKKMATRNLEKEFKDEDNKFRLAIVCAMWITGFDAPCVSTVYLDKPIKGHTLMQTIARANRVYDDEKENGLIIDYGNVYTKLEDAYAIYGEGDNQTKSQGDDSDDDIKTPAEKLELLTQELESAITEVRQCLMDLEFDLDELINLKTPMEKLGIINKALNCVCLNEKSRTEFEFLARNVFRKFKALYPEDEVKPYISQKNAIEAIYEQLNQNVQSADISSVIRGLQQEVNMSITLAGSDYQDDDDYVDISNLDFDKLQKAFNKSNNKNRVVFDLQSAVENKLQKMMQQNPLRLKFHDKYKKIIDDYNNGKDIAHVEKAFNDLKDFMDDLSEEESRAVKEGLDQDTLAIFDLLRKSTLTSEEEKKVKQVAVKTLDSLREEKLNIERWRESTQVTAQVKTIIYDNLQWLPQKAYSDEELSLKTDVVYQHIYSSYRGSRLMQEAS